jgi:hypothetical protein
MKTLIFTLSIILTFSIISCKKDSTTNENSLKKSKGVQPLSYIMNNQKIADSLINNYGEAVELGIRFKSSSNGIINQVGLKSPVIGQFPVTIWEVSTQKLLATVNVNTKENEFSYSSITPLNIQANTEYVISFNNYDKGESRRYFVAQNRNREDIYPFYAYGIEFLDFRVSSSTSTKFPTIIPAYQQVNIPGILDFEIEFTGNSNS